MVLENLHIQISNVQANLKELIKIFEFARVPEIKGGNTSLDLFV